MTQQIADAKAAMPTLVHAGMHCRAKGSSKRSNDLAPGQTNQGDRTSDTLDSNAPLHKACAPSECQGNNRPEACVSVFRINRRAAGVAVESHQMPTDTRQINEAINRAKQVILGDVVVYRKLIKQCALRLLLRSQHRNHPPLLGTIESVTKPQINRSFSTKYAICLHLRATGPS